MFLIYFIEQYKTQVPTDFVIYFRFGFILLTVLIFSLFNFWVGIRLSHKIAGPLVQVQRVLEFALKGEYETRIKLRSGDFLHEFGDNINSLLDKLERTQDMDFEFKKSEIKNDKISSENAIFDKEVYK
jgi:signal transduction histidine kinase